MNSYLDHIDHQKIYERTASCATLQSEIGVPASTKVVCQVCNEVCTASVSRTAHPHWRRKPRTDPVMKRVDVLQVLKGMAAVALQQSEQRAKQLPGLSSKCKEDTDRQ